MYVEKNKIQNYSMYSYILSRLNIRVTESLFSFVFRYAFTLKKKKIIRISSYISAHVSLKLLLYLSSKYRRKIIE